MSIIKKVGIPAIILGVITLIVGVISWDGIVGYNIDNQYRVKQSFWAGDMSVQFDAGRYNKMFAKETPYDKSIQAMFGEQQTTQNRVTFRDGGKAWLSATYRFRMPTSEEKALLVHREFNANQERIEAAIEAHLINCIKATGPLMSATEHQAARKAEFNQLVDNMLRKGLYKMSQRETTELAIRDGKEVEVTSYTTEISRDSDLNPIIDQVSPLEQYGFVITQFSITSSEYDEQTQEQFGKKKDAALAGELAKMNVEKEKQETLKAVQTGLREKAEAEAIALKEKATAVIQAEREKEVAETNAARVLAVAQLDKETAETKAAQLLEVAKLNKEAATEDAEAIRILAAAQEEKIAKAGAITEEVRVLAEIAAKRDVQVAEFLSQIKTPSVVIVGGEGEGEGQSSLQDNLVNLRLLQSTGVLPTQGLDNDTIIN